MKKSAIVEIISSVLIFLFIYAALSKILDLDKFKYQLSQSPFISNISGFVAWAIPMGEILIAISLIFKRTRLTGLYLSFFLMQLFTGYIFIMLRYSSYLPCSCGGVLSNMSWKQHFFFNLGFTGWALTGIMIQTTRTARDHIKPMITGMKPNTCIKK